MDDDSDYEDDEFNNLALLLYFPRRQRVSNHGQIISLIGGMMNSLIDFDYPKIQSIS